MNKDKEQATYDAAGSGARIFLGYEHGLVQGRVTWVADYTLGFVPDEVQPAEAYQLAKLGMVPGVETMISKSMIRCVTPEKRGDHGRKGKGGSADSVRGLQPVAAADRKHRKTTR